MSKSGIMNLYNPDAQCYLHPDEAYDVNLTPNLTLPRSFKSRITYDPALHPDITLARGMPILKAYKKS